MSAIRQAASILVIAGDPAVSGTVVDRLALAGHRVRTARSAKDAFLQLEGQHPDLILLDLNVPDVDGLVLLAKLRSLTAAPIITCSVTPGRWTAVLSLKLGADDFLPIPFDVDELDARVGALLRRAGARVPR
jgi:two-component system response regulator AdeR